MLNKKQYSMLFICLLLTVSLMGSVSAVTDFSETKIKHDFYPVDFIFQYSDKNTTTYEGDLGLKGAICRNTEDNISYYAPVENVRGIAYATKKTFRFNEPIQITHSLKSNKAEYDYIVMNMYYKNGSTLRKLDISDSMLTADEIEYFDDYRTQKQEYYNKHYADQLDTIETYQEYQASSSNKQRGYMIGTNGIGFYSSF
ncbi:hypothetical protein [Methanosphaera sp. WGK6]|uniref:hypothetical protein n=1 Tax=Methanosphaera sp. WGK6 TaxID=1561964 RepID=UPI00084CC543|nr:hypothetical protein [Methanosphaera sp. WGK6]OED30366.1 hypothetical protein NL43_03050 [Methanosphaera sp. WGK6]